MLHEAICRSKEKSSMIQVKSEEQQKIRTNSLVSKWERVSACLYALEVLAVIFLIRPAAYFGSYFLKQ